MRRFPGPAVALLLGLGGCEPARGPVPPGRIAAGPQVPDSVLVAVDGPTLVAFHPVVSNDSLERDEDLAAALDDLAYHVAGAMDSLVPVGFRFAYRGGDTVWLRIGADQVPVIRDRDSADIGIVLADRSGRREIHYGVQTSDRLVELARAFLRAPPAPAGR